MGYARHIGRVGALAVALGIGAAIASTPGIAYAGPSGASPSGETSSETESSSTSTTSAGTGSAAADADDADSSASERKAHRRSVLRSVVKSILNSTAVKTTSDDSSEAGSKEATGKDDTSNTDVAGAQEEDNTLDSVSGDLADRKASNTNTSRRAHTRSLADTIGDVATAINTATERGEKAFQSLSTPGETDTATTYSFATAPIVTARTAVTPFSAASAISTPAEPEAPTSVVSIVTDLLGSLLHPLLYPGTGAPPLQAPTLMVILAAVRDEIERILLPRPAPPAPPQTQGQPIYPDPPADPTKQHVLVIAIDGTNMDKVLADDSNENFFELMDTSTNSAPSIVGHTTVSNPSWTAILTGAWDNKTGVINNVYTPQTYDRWPTVFTQLETYDSNIQTKAIADWDVIGAIAASGDVGADEVVYIAQKPNDPDWSKTDQAVTDEAVKTIEGTEAGYEERPNFLVTYLVQVDENGHLYGADSDEYEEAIQRTDDNLGEILAAVQAREDATGCATNSPSCEDWTVIVVTDHGHQPQQGFGHGFQSPDETTTFVIADGPQFGDSVYNPEYEIVDVTPTVLSLFGAPECRNCDGVPLTSLRGSDSDPLTQVELQELLKGQMAANDYPNIVTNVALSLRTIVAFVPYYVYGAGLPTPIGEILYVGTNVPAQLVAFFTGVYGVRLFPILPPPPAITFIPDDATSIDAFLRMDCGSDSLAPAGCVAV